MRRIFLSFLLVALPSCGRKSNDPAVVPTPPTPAPPPSGLVDDGEAQSLLTTFCAPCHAGPQAPMGILLDTSANARKNPGIMKDSVKELIKNDQGQVNDMPPTEKASTKQPTDAQRQKLAAWFKQGN